MSDANNNITSSTSNDNIVTVSPSTKMMSHKNETTTTTTTETKTGGVKDFIAQTNIIGNVIAAAASQKNSFEPLPFTDYSLFKETYSKFFLLF